MTRVPLVTAANATGEAALVLEKLESAGVRLNLMFAMANSSTCFRDFMRLGNSLMESSLSPRTRELVILCVAKLADARYVWQQHEQVAKREGISESEIESLAEGRIPSSVAPDEADALGFARAALYQEVPEEVFNAALFHFGPEGVVDLAMTAAWWGAFVPRLVEALDVDLEDR